MPNNIPDRDWVINGETLVRVKFGAHISPTVSNISGSMTTLCELGLAEDQIRIRPRFVHKDINVDDYGPDIPADVIALMADCTISMNLVHTSIPTLDVCLGEALGGQVEDSDNDGSLLPFGTLPGAGLTLGRGCQPLASGCHYVSLSLLSPQLKLPWRFPTAYLYGTPMEWPLGTKYSSISLNWRAIPYSAPTGSLVLSTSGVAVPFGEVYSSGSVLLDHGMDN